MQLEWNRFLEGITDFKTDHGMLWIFSLVLLWICFKKGTLKRHRWLLTSLVLGVLVICPVTAMALLKIFTPFYDWSDLQLLLPTTLLMALLGVEAYDFLRKQEIPGLHPGQTAKNIISVVCVAVLLLTATGFHGLDRYPEADEHGVPLETAEVFEALEQVIGEERMVLAAPAEMLQYTRLYEPKWQPVYGRDLWSGKSASYINSGYDIEYEYYTLLAKAQLTEKEQESFAALIREGQADCVIVPAFWVEQICELPEYESILLTDSYAGIIKKDFVTK